MKNTVLVVGGTGYFGRLLVEDLRQHVGCTVVTAGRRRADVILDLTRPPTLSAALDRAGIVVCAAGPFQKMPVTLAQLCIERGIHYVDLADDRAFVLQVRALGRAAKTSAVCAGWSAVPALSAALTRMAAHELPSIEEIFVQIAPGNRFPRSHATVSSLVSSVGKPFRVWRDNRWTDVTGWSAPREFEFPSPVGKRVGFMVDVPDLEIFPELFGAKRVEFRVGAELPVLNQAVSLLARTGWNWSKAATLARWGMAAFQFFGTSGGAVGVEVTGGGKRCRACVLADTDGQRIPVLPASVMCAQLLSGQREHRGVVPLDKWIDRPQLDRECRRRGFRLVVGS